MLNSINRKLLLISWCALSFSTHADPVTGQGNWESTLLGRDASGNAVAANSSQAVFLYDTTLNITWLKNANSNGPMTWTTATTWAQNLNVDGFTGWSLPTTAIPDSTCSIANANPAVYGQGYGVGCSGSEMGHLFNVTLGNAPGKAISNTGNFTNIQNYYYWSGTIASSDSYYVWTYQTSINGQAYTGTGTNAFFALAVHQGDVLTPVPEPENYAMLLAGLGLIGVAIKRRKEKQA